MEGHDIGVSKDKCWLDFLRYRSKVLGIMLFCPHLTSYPVTEPLRFMFFKLC